MKTMTSSNGQMRKSLASQIDRLDGVLDGLADNLNEAVAAAVKEAVGLAVQEAIRGVLREILANPALIAKLQGAVLPAMAAGTTAPKPGLKERVGKVTSWLGKRVQAARHVCRGWLQKARKATVTAVNTACQTCNTLKQWAIQKLILVWLRLQLARHFWAQFLTALLVGSASGIAVFFAEPWLAAIVGGIGGFTLTLAVEAGLLLRRLLVVEWGVVGGEGKNEGVRRESMISPIETTS